MRIDSCRFGTLEIDEMDLLHFPSGLVGFPGKDSYILLRRTPTSRVGWLQSIRRPELALPVASIESLARDVPVEMLSEALSKTGLGGELDDCAVMVVICATETGATVNLLAPIIVNSKTREGAQVILEDSDFSAREEFSLSPRSAPQPILRPQPTPRTQLTATP